MKMTYCLSNADRSGSWSWGTRSWSAEDWREIIEPAFVEFEKLTWADIDAQTSGGHRKHHSQEVSSICTEARTRWPDLDLSQYDEAFRFRLGGTRRIWGYRLLAHFHFVWWDPQHNIYPTEPANT